MVVPQLALTNHMLDPDRLAEAVIGLIACSAAVQPGAGSERPGSIMQVTAFAFSYAGVCNGREE